jgi:hypothetical protein
VQVGQFGTPTQEADRLMRGFPTGAARGLDCYRRITRRQLLEWPSGKIKFLNAAIVRHIDARQDFELREAATPTARRYTSRSFLLSCEPRRVLGNTVPGLRVIKLSQIPKQADEKPGIFKLFWLSFRPVCICLSSLLSLGPIRPGAAARHVPEVAIV